MPDKFSKCFMDFIFFFTFFLNKQIIYLFLGIVDLQYYISFRCITQWCNTLHLKLLQNIS